MSKTFKIGQTVYTSRLIRGWFDYSLKLAIPENTSGVIISIISEDHYEIDFGQEFGKVQIHHNNLKK